jgi:hypothetical protein
MDDGGGFTMRKEAEVAQAFILSSSASELPPPTTTIKLELLPTNMKTRLQE